MLVTVARYRSITGDNETAASAVSARIEEATDILEDLLDRPLEQAERTEALHPTRDGWLWPRAVPILSAPSGYEVDGHGLRGAHPWPLVPFGIEGDTISVTYTGGFLERTANPGTYALPTYMERDLAFAAYRLEHLPTPVTDVPIGATSARVGDVATTWAEGSPGAQPTTDVLTDVWSARTLAWRYRPIGGVP